MVISDEIKLRLLGYFYEVFQKAALNKYKKGTSLFFQFIESTSGSRSEILRHSVINIDYENFSSEDIESLVENNYIMKAECDACFALTAKGLFFIEEQRGLIDLEKLIYEYQIKYFNVFKGEIKLKDVEKTVLFSLICSRSFSIDSCMKLTIFGRENDIWIRIFRKCAFFLKEINFIETIPPKLIDNSEGYETPLMYIMRRLDHLQEKTRNIYCFNNNKSYYLNLDGDSDGLMPNLPYIFKKIFDKALSLKETEKISEFINKISSEEIIHMTEHNGKRYSTPSVDLLLEKSLLEAAFGKI